MIGKFRQAELLQQGIDPGREVLDFWPVITRRLLQIAADGEVAVEGVILGADAQRPPRLIPVGRQIMPRDADTAGIRTEKSITHPERGGLAGTVGPEQADHLAGAAGEIHAIHHRPAAEGFLQATDFQQGPLPGVGGRRMMGSAFGHEGGGREDLDHTSGAGEICGGAATTWETSLR